MTTFLKPLLGGLVLSVLLTGCGGDGSSSNGQGPVSGPTGAASGPTLAQQIETLERKGDYPTLDRSSDIAGPDANHNGVRDDIEAWINTLPVSDAQRRSLMQDARATQQTLLIDLKDQTALDDSGKALAASMNCGAKQFSPYQEFSKLAGKIEAMTANTKERALRYMQYNAAMSGSSTTSPRGDTCEP